MNEEMMWQAVLDKDKNQDGEFVFAVRSTKIYCRPSCASRRPLRENVSFFEEPEAAEQAGFRACLRCQPKEVRPQKELAQQVCNYIEANLENSLTLDTLGAELNVSPQHLQRVFKKVIGISPRQYAEAYRVKRLKERLREGDNVTTALYEAGFGSSSRLYENAPARLGMTPAVYKKGGMGMKIEFSLTENNLGWLLVAATEQGICTVAMGDDTERLEANLRQEYPNAQIRRDDKALLQWTSQILNHLNGRQPDLDLPIAIAYTPFQKKVWEELRYIPYGSTRSYGDIAEAIGQPSASRAVARACATNPVALIIPCHRVVRENGDLGGYRWGIERKRQLLTREASAKVAS